VRIKIPKNSIQLVTKAVSQNAPKVMSKVSEVATPVIMKAGTHIKPVADVIAKNPGKTLIGVLGIGVAADDIHQRHSNKVLKKKSEEREMETKRALQKHEAEIQELKVQADKVENLEIINEQLCNAIKETRKGEPDEEVYEDGTTDK